MVTIASDQQRRQVVAFNLLLGGAATNDAISAGRERFRYAR